MFPSLGPGEMIVVMVVAVLLFGKRLPEVGRSLGKGIVEFKRGLSGLGDDDEPNTASNGNERRPAASSTQAVEPSVPKFEPPTGPPVLESSPTASSL